MLYSKLLYDIYADGEAKPKISFPFFVGSPHTSLPFCPSERKLSKVSVRIRLEKSSDFIQETQLKNRIVVFAKMRSGAPHFGEKTNSETWLGVLDEVRTFLMANSISKFSIVNTW
ncbi:hypothetical protein A2732_00075 [Candidatus Nomurabacteria bacterium RIFCSPHIGHO2_01_FULL_40_10]|nr:MAG: hypothetical protein A2732_00075 [Candidatus Nomurabacteria bacterium RIFCSPHIGHO2_01_FULL_40_10]